MEALYYGLDCQIGSNFLTIDTQKYYIGSCVLLCSMLQPS